MVSVIVGVSVGGKVISRVSGTGLGVMLPKDETVGVLVADLTVGVVFVLGTATKLGVREGTALVITLVGVEVGTASFLDGELDPATKAMTPPKMTSVTTLKTTPPADGRSLKTKSVIRPMMLTMAKWTRNTSKPCNHTFGRPEPMPNPAALIGK